MSSKINSTSSQYDTIRTISEKLLSTFASAGIVLTEAQKSDVDSFVKAIESKIESQKRDTIKATAQVVEKRLGEEYRKVFESILAKQAVFCNLSEKIAAAKAKVQEAESISSKVGEFVDAKLAECLPAESIVDYHKFKLMENTIAGLKEALLIGEADVQKAISEEKEKLEESFKEKEAVYKRNLEAMHTKMRKAVAESTRLKSKAGKIEAEAYLSEKVADLPLFEARQIKKRLAGCSVEEIKEKFDSVYESVAMETTAQADKASGKSLEEEINDILKNGEKPAAEKKICGKTEKNEGKVEDDKNAGEEETDEAKQLSESMSQYSSSLYADDTIDGDMMLSWMNCSENINQNLF